MIKLLSSYLINIIYKSNRITCDERAIYEYCVRTILKRILFVIIIVFYGFLTKHIDISIVFLFVFIHLRSFCGGAHAPTPIVCSILSYGVCLSALFLVFEFNNYTSYISLLLLMSIFTIPLLILSPVDTKNKRLTFKKKATLKRKCNVTILFDFFLFFVFYLINAKSCCMTIAVCVTICSISVIIGFIQNRRLNNAF